MTDNQLIALFGGIITAGLTANGVSANLAQSYEPTKQGVSSSNTVYFFKINDKRHGWVNRANRWDALTSKMVFTETQVVESTFQINALARQNPAVLSKTASDIVGIVASIMQSQSTITTLQAAGVGIYRITEIRNPYFMDDRDQYEASPSFDFTLVYNQSIITTAPIVQTIEYNFKRTS